MKTRITNLGIVLVLVVSPAANAGPILALIDASVIWNGPGSNTVPDQPPIRWEQVMELIELQNAVPTLDGVDRTEIFEKSSAPMPNEGVNAE